MNVLKPFLNPKKLRKLQNNPQAFFKDALDKRIIPIQNQLKSFKPKKKNSFAEYYIISAVYNVEKYLDDYFNSILKQRLDFKNNITIICVDDGSTDNSAKIIQKYQKKFPKNIVYLHKENGGQASARNLGIRWLQEKLGYLEGSSAEITGEIPNYRLPRDSSESLAMTQSKSHKPIWVTFTDPDDFLDRDYFYEVDKFLEGNADKDICMVGCNIIIYYESQKAFSDSHPGNHQFIKDFSLIELKQNTSFGMITSTRSFFDFNIIQKYRIYFDEKCKPSFEDGKFIAHYLLPLSNAKILFLKNAKYCARRRATKNSTLDISRADIEQYLTSIDVGTLSVLNDHYKGHNEKIPDFIQNICLIHLFFNYKDIVNNPQKLYFMDEQQKIQYLNLLDENFTFIDTQTILTSRCNGLYFDHKVGILNCFKKEYPPFQITYIDAFDSKKEQILIRYFTPDDKDIESIRIDGKEVYADYEKIVQNDFLDRVFCYEKRLWVHIPQNSNKLEIFIRGQRARITYGGKQHQSLEIKHIKNKFKQLTNVNNLWLLKDRDTEADDNAEHFYRYLAKNYPKQSIVFALSKESKDWERLKAEGFNLVNFDSLRFKEILKSCGKVISSHLDFALMQHIHRMPDVDFIFIEHGETIAHNCATWFNGNPIRLFISACKKEYNNIAKDYTKYKLGNREVRLTGLARYDSLLLGNNSSRKILIMPTWRVYLRGLAKGVPYSESKENLSAFMASEYFVHWNSFLKNKSLQKLCNLYHYEVIFVPHFQIRGYLECFEIPSYINVEHRESGYSLQRTFQECSLLITDYSSITFSIAYLKKPTIYYRFNETDKITIGHHQEDSRFDYCTDGFGPVVSTEEDLLKELEILLQNDCAVGEPYKSNIENIFEFRDGKCCERIYQEILELDKPYERKWTLDYVFELATNALNAKCYKEASERFKFVLEHLGELTTASLQGHSPASLRGSEANEAIHNPANQNTNNGIAKNNGEIQDYGLPRDSSKSLAMTKSYQMRHCEQSEAIHNQTYLKDSIAESRVDKINDKLNEEIIFNYLYASRLNQTSQEALEFIKAQDYESKLVFSNKVKFEIIKNYIEIIDAQEVIDRLEVLREAIPEQELLEFAYLKLRIYAYLGDKQKLKEVYNELKNTYNIDKKDLDLDLFLFQNELIKAASIQATATSAGGGDFYEFSNLPNIQ